MRHRQKQALLPTDFVIGAPFICVRKLSSSRLSSTPRPGVSEFFGDSTVRFSDMVQERMRAHNQRYAHEFLRLFIFVQKAALRFFNFWLLSEGRARVLRGCIPALPNEVVRILCLQALSSGQATQLPSAIRSANHFF